MISFSPSQDLIEMVVKFNRKKKNYGSTENSKGNISRSEIFNECLKEKVNGDYRGG